MLSTYSFDIVQVVNSMHFSKVAFRMKEELVAPNKTDLHRYVCKWLFGSVGFPDHRNRIESLSSSCKPTWRKAFIISVIMVTGFALNASKSLSSLWGPAVYPLGNRLSLVHYSTRLNCFTGVILEYLCTRWRGIYCIFTDVISSTFSIKPRHSFFYNVSIFIE